LVGCSPAEPTSVSPGVRDVPQVRPGNKSKPPSEAARAGVTTRKAGQGVAKDRSFFV